MHVNVGCLSHDISEEGEIMKNKFGWINMKRVLSGLGVVIAFLILVCMIVCGYKFYKSYTSIEGIKGEECIGKKRSPDNRYEAQAFRNNGGATTDYAVLVVLIDLKNGTEKNIFWDYHCDYVEMKWNSNNIIEINGIVLKVPDQVYDYRKNKSANKS